ncbi:MAG: pilus assembly protein [Planctomycetaceae bacterium]|nr:pilus assembly protein [Planctomycetaceae bacterium]
MRRFTNTSKTNLATRRGAAVVEFAIMAPVFLTLTLGSIEVGYALNASNTLYGALREGGRLASQDWSTMLAPGETANAKVIQDIKNMLTASRIPGNQVTIEIVHADGPNAGSPFDLEDEDNYLQMFTITGSVPFDQITLLPGNYLGGSDLQAAITFRMGRTTLD